MANYRLYLAYLSKYITIQPKNLLRQKTCVYRRRNPAFIYKHNENGICDCFAEFVETCGIGKTASRVESY